MKSKITKILVLGETGNGKSTFCNYVLGEKRCEESPDPDSHTFDVIGYMAKENSKNHDIMVIDTPGLSDSKGRDQEIINMVRTKLSKEHCNGIKSIVIIINANVPRFSKESQRIISLFCKMFPHKEFWYHVAIVFSMCYESWPETQLNKVKEIKQQKFMINFMEAVDTIVKEMNGELSDDKKIQIPGNFQTYFLDCGEVYPPFNHNRTDEQINKLLWWSRNQNYLDFDENDLNGQVFADYKDKKEIADHIEKEDVRISDSEIKYINNYYKQYRVIDFYDKTQNIPEEKPYKTEIFYIISEITETEKTEGTKVEGVDLKKKVKTIIKRKKIIKKYDENKKYLETLKEEPLPDSSTENILDSEYRTKTVKETRYRVLDYVDEQEKDSPTAVQEYINEMRRLSTGKKILFVGFNIVHFVAGLTNLVLFIVSKFQKKKRWKIVTRTYKDAIYEREIKIDEFDVEYPGKWKEKEVLKTWKEISEPIRMD